MVDFTEEEHATLSHYGIKRKSGRYPYGSGGNELARAKDFQSYFREMTKEKGLSQAKVAEALTAYANDPSRMGPKDRPVSIKTQDIRAAVATSAEIVKADNVARARQLAARDYSNGTIAEMMGLKRSQESTVRGWLQPSADRNANTIRATSETLKEHLETKPFLDVGKGTHLYMGITSTKLKTALSQLKDEGYQVHNIKVPQLGGGPDQKTNTLVLTKADWSTTRKAVDAGDIQNVTTSSTDGGLKYKAPRTAPTQTDLKRIEVRYADEGGLAKDGVIEVRRGVPDLDMGAARYAQVRVAVAGSHYLKGMAIYADDLPPGVDIRFNSAKTKVDAEKKGPDAKLGAMKPLEKDKDGNVDNENPFKASIRKVNTYLGKDGKEKQGLLNIVNEEGTWDWKDSLSSQMLSKQAPGLAKKQLKEAADTQEKEFAEIKRLTNPVVKQKLLNDFADNADAAAVDLKAASIAGQASRVLLPINSLRRNEIYAPDLDDGTNVALVRFPHAGPFEIPELKVNNKNAEARRLIRGAKDAVGIHHSVAEKLSGADFDGDAVLVIPNNNRAVKSRPSLKELEGFDAKQEYAGTDTSVRMKKTGIQKQMGDISNLITDMNVKGAPDSEMARAVRHSMVVIDAEKHGLDYKRSAKEHSIAQLKEKYQGGPTKGAATIISRASSTARIDQVKSPYGNARIDPKTGEIVRVKTGDQYVDYKTGEVLTSKTKGTQMEFARDARELLSGGPNGTSYRIEEIYADHANTMKSLANRARLELLNTPSPLQNKTAKATYGAEVKSLMDKLKIAERNAPLERQAQVLGGAMARARIDANPQWEKDDIKKVRYQELDRARFATGAGKVRIGSKDTGRDPNGTSLSEREWEAIQAGAVSATTLRSILANADMDRIRTLATPRPSSTLTTTQINRAQALLRSGNRSVTEVAQLLGVPRSTLSNNL